MSAIVNDAFIQSLAGSGSVISGSVAPNSLVITDAKPGDVFSGVISGTGGLRITGGTQTLTGMNTYTGNSIPTSKQPVPHWQHAAKTRNFQRFSPSHPLSSCQEVLVGEQQA
jgi:hypothetical protein